MANSMDGFTELHVHPDVPDGLSALAELGIRMVTLSTAQPPSRNVYCPARVSTATSSGFCPLLRPGRIGVDQPDPVSVPQLLPAADPPGRLSAAACAPAALT